MAFSTTPTYGRTVRPTARWDTLIYATLFSMRSMYCTVDPYIHVHYISILYGTVLLLLLLLPLPLLFFFPSPRPWECSLLQYRTVRHSINSTIVVVIVRYSMMWSQVMTSIRFSFTSHRQLLIASAWVDSQCGAYSLAGMEPNYCWSRTVQCSPVLYCTVLYRKS